MATGFTVVNHFIDAYRTYTGKSLPTFSYTAKVTFNTRVQHLRQAYGFDVHDMIALIDFAYLHNPLGYGDNIAYGAIDQLYKVAPIFKAWRRQHAATLSRITLRDLVYRLRPTDAYACMSQEMSKELFEAVQSNVRSSHA